MWPLPEILTQNNPELGQPETEGTKKIKALNRRRKLVERAIEELEDEAELAS